MKHCKPLESTQYNAVILTTYTGTMSHVVIYILLLSCFDVLGTSRGPTDRIQHINKHSMICQVETIDFPSQIYSEKTTTCIWFRISEKGQDRKGLLKRLA